MTPTVQILMEAGRVAMERRREAARRRPFDPLPLSLYDCGPCMERGVCREAQADMQLWPGGPWAYVCGYCAHRLRPRVEWGAALARGFGPSSRRVS